MCFLYLNLHRLVGLRRLRLCLKLRLGLCPFLVSEVEQEIYPTSPLTPGPRLRLSARYARCCFLLLACSLLWSAMLIPHSSLMPPFSLHIVSPPSRQPFSPHYFAVLCNFTIIFVGFAPKIPSATSIFPFTSSYLSTR